MILQDAFTVEPWNLRETHLDLDLLAQRRAVPVLQAGARAENQAIPARA